MKLYILLLSTILLASKAKEPTESNIYISRDYGQHWDAIGAGLPTDAYINAWTVHQSTIVAGTESNGIYISYDGAKNWQRSSKGLPMDIKVNALISHGNILLAGTYRNGIYISHNGGNTWQPSSKGIGTFSIRSFHIHNNILFAGTDDGVYASTDQGISWQPVLRGYQINAFTSDNGNILTASNVGIFRSADSGKSWTLQSGMGAFATLATDSDKLVAVMYDGRAYVSSDHGILWLHNEPFFDKYTFKLTPSGSTFPAAPWRDSLPTYYYQKLSGRHGLPNKNFSLLLNTPYGLLTTIGGGGGC
ncbi:MAG TPA: hypothetical protein VIN08_05455 [Ohtaekwangia sp.]|uniref:WD40/YVTN/BNR-like repeat-containing protein n=1 Tax=Ohtaekwangia sp. TaxID=2066019 RepID=UPI002F957265